MALAYSLDDIVRTSDDAAVRSYFDARTRVTLRIISLVFLIVAVPYLISALGHANAVKAMLATAFMLFAAIIVAAFRKKARPGLARLVTQDVRGVAIGWILAEGTLLFLLNAPTEGVMAFAGMIPMALIGYRLLPAEHMLLHGTLAAISTAIIATMVDVPGSAANLIIPALVMNGMSLMLALFISRRARRNVTERWAERRASAREQIRMRDELQYARELQLSMLPECAPSMAWADLCAVSVPATEVGGDYYDYFVDEERVAVVCGDVAGHGMASGLVLASLRSGFTLLRDSLTDPAGVLRRLHDLVAETSRRRMLVTVSVVLLDHRNRRATIASAGHPPIVVGHADGTVETVELFAPPLGVRLPVAIPQRTLDLRPGDVFVLHSDGVYETRSEADETYGLERLAQVVRENISLDAEALRDAIVADVERFRGGAAQEDDVTVVVARVR